jgi:hypothetical protein
MSGAGWTSVIAVLVLVACFVYMLRAPYRDQWGEREPTEEEWEE